MDDQPNSRSGSKRAVHDDGSWAPLAWFGRLPGRLVPTGDEFSAANLFGPASRIYWMKALVACGLILGLLLSPRLWAGARFFPPAPVLDVIPPVPFPLDWIVLFALLAVLAATILSPRPRPFIWAIVAIVCLLAFFDQARLQPWVYQYAVMLAALGLFSWRVDDEQCRDAALNVCRLAVAGIYFWSGLQKANAEFVNDVFPWMLGPVSQLFPQSAQPLLNMFGMLVPAVEMAIGIGLLTMRLRNIAIGLALAMCIFVLWTLGPFGRNVNSVVWPWNATLALIVIALFAGSKAVPLRDILWVKGSAFHKAVLVGFGVLPLLYFFNAWDAYLSWSLYSGTTHEAEILLSDKVKERLPEPVQALVQTERRDANWLDVGEWSYAELNVPPYPEPRVYKSVARAICRHAGEPGEVVLLIRGRLSWFNRDGLQRLNCAELK